MGRHPAAGRAPGRPIASTHVPANPDLRPRVDAAGGLDLELPALSRALLDRASDRRGDGAWWSGVRADPGTRWLRVSDGRVPVVAAGTGSALVWSTGPPPDIDPGEVFLLGVDADGRAHVAVRVGTDAAAPPPGAAEPGAPEAAAPDAGASDAGDGAAGGGHVRWAGLREVGGELGDLDAGAATHATALLTWHAGNGFSPATGAPTEPARSGSVRVEAGGREQFPRTDPAMIVLVHDRALGDPDCRVLLGHQVVWPAGRFSCLAGFVEAGESLEQSVVREVAEESGVTVDAVRYAGSQPWPFPRSLMVGFTALAAATGTRPDGDEIAELRWFTRSQLLAAVEADEVRLPGTVSIARRLIEAWYGGRLPGDW